MATNMKTIKFGENGEVYAVNAPVVSGGGTLADVNRYLDCGTFADGLTELTIAVNGVANAEGTYVISVVNGVESKFVTINDFYKSKGGFFHIKKVGDVWTAIIGKGGAVSMYAEILETLASVDKITSFSVKAYDETGFAAGTMYCWEGR